jgi:N utilization substance protein B
MKFRNDPRHHKRQQVIQQLFSWSFHDQDKKVEKTKEIIANIELTDPIIEKYAKEWPLSQIAKIDLAILRLALFELFIEKNEPIKVVIDEAVELAKEFGGESSPAFVNGVLGTVVKEELKGKNEF